MKYIVFIIMLFLFGCGGDPCGFSDMCYVNREIERIKNLSDNERSIEIKNCITQKQKAIDNAVSEKTECNFWRCVEGKETFRIMQKSCVDYYNPENWKNQNEK